jgi:uncharacterized membrane protein
MEQTSPKDSGAHANRTLMAVLAYLGILVIIPFLMAKEDGFVRFHIRQGIVLVIIEIAIWVLGSMSWQLWPLLQLVNLGVLVLAIIGIVNVVNNKEAELPLVGSFARNINI